MALIEIETFRLRSDEATEVEAFRTIDERVQTEVVYRLDGVLRRTVARGGDGWLVITQWGSADAADAGRRAIDASEHERARQTFVEASTRVTTRYETLS